MTEGLQREYWDQVAGATWVAAQAQMDSMLSRYAETLREPVRRLAPRRLVDVGCGCGATTLMAREEAPDADILGVDVSGPMLARAEQRARAAGDRDTRFVLADAATHPLPAGTVDLIISRFGLMFFEDPTAAFSHMRAWLRPEGRLSAVIWGPPEENPWMTEMMGVLARELELPPPEPDAPGPFALGATEKRAAIFAQAGLEIEGEQFLTDPLQVSGSFDEVVTFYTQRGPASVALREATPADRDRAIAALTEQVKRHYHHGGVSLPAHAVHLTLRPST